MRILNLQNAVLVSLAVATVALGACSSSDTPRPTGTAGASNTTAGAGNTVAGDGSIITAGSGNPSGGADQGGAGAPPAGGGMDSGMAGGTVGGAGGPPSVCDGLGTKILAAMPADAFIDDFECKTAPCTAPKTVADGWSTFADLGKAGTDIMNMEMADNMVNMLGIMPGAATTAHGGQYKGTGANVSTKAPGFGVGAIYNLVIDPTLGIYCADISAFDGVSFWAKTGIAAGSTVSVNFALPNTNAEVMMNGKEAGGDCKVGCYNHPHKLVTLSADWMQYTVTFAEAAGGSAKVKNLVQLLGFLSPDAAWDFSLDEIAFYKTTPPAAAVAPPAAAAP